MIDTVKTLSILSGVSGWEDEVRDYILDRAMSLADEIATDTMGNLYALKKGRNSSGAQVMVCAHMDEVGLIVSGFTEDGFLRFDFVGGVDRRVVLGKRVAVGPDHIPGIVGLKPCHLLSPGEENTVPKTEDLYIDIGAQSEKAARSLVKLGWRCVFDERVVCFGDGFIKAKALDDRVGCAAMLQLLQETPPTDTWFVFTVQEEVGCRGAAVASNRIRPSVAFVLEGTTAADIAGVDAGRNICHLGHGIVIPFMDHGTVYNRNLFDFAVRTAEKHDIPWQNKEYVAGGTDASVIQRSGDGALVLTLSVPLRSIHSPCSVGKIEDIVLLPKLCHHLLEELAHGL